MTLRLTPKEYRTLVKMIWMSEHVVVGSELADSDTVGQMLDLSSKIYQAAPDFAAEDIFVSDSEEQASDAAPGNEAIAPEADGELGQGVRLRPEIEDELHSIIEWYEEFSFWELLEDRLAMRDIADGRTEAQWNWLPDDEKDKLYFKHLNFYYEEFSEFGIQNLRLAPADPDKSRIPLAWQDDEARSPDQPGESPEGIRPSSTRAGRPGKIIEFPGSKPDKPPKKPRE